MSDLYDSDILIWSEQQAALLRRLAGGERVNDADLDWSNIAEEIESVGREQLHSVEALIVQALAHRMKAEAWPSAKLPLERWRMDAELFGSQAAARFVPSMRQRIDMEKLYRRALRWLPPEIDGLPPQPLPTNCPVTLDELLGNED